MSFLAHLPKLIGSFGFSREDDESSNGALSARGERIQHERRRREVQAEQSIAEVERHRAAEQRLRDVAAAKHRTERRVGRRRRTAPSLARLCVLGAAIIAWLIIPPAPPPALAAST